MDFSLLYFANRTADDPPRQYDLLLRSARFADTHGFTAVWMPERHFHPFGGAYPNPALAAAVLATHTTRLRLRAGSVVLPLHDPLTVVEDWAFVDNLSRGRVDLALATGWMANDFVLAPDRYAHRHQYVADNIATLEDLWAGRTLTRRNGDGKEVGIVTYPRPVQPSLSLWLTAASQESTFRQAGACGKHVLTALLFQSVEELAHKIDVYRTARAEHGHDPAAGIVTLMLHTHVRSTDDEAREQVRGPFLRYLDSSVDLWQRQWPQLAGTSSRARLLDIAFERYWCTAALFGSVERCASLTAQLAEAGVDEIASLIDFGLPEEKTIAALHHLDRVRDGATALPPPSCAGTGRR